MFAATDAKGAVIVVPFGDGWFRAIAWDRLREQAPLHDPLPMDVDRIDPGTFVGEVVMKQEITPFLREAQGKGCPIQVGKDMLFEMIPAYLEFFGFGTATPEELRAVSRVEA